MSYNANLTHRVVMQLFISFFFYSLRIVEFYNLGICFGTLWMSPNSTVTWNRPKCEITISQIQILLSTLLSSYVEKYHWKAHMLHYVPRYKWLKNGSWWLHNGVMMWRSAEKQYRCYFSVTFMTVTIFDDRGVTSTVNGVLFFEIL